MIKILKKYKVLITIIIIFILIISSIFVRKSLEETNDEIEEDNIVENEITKKEPEEKEEDTKIIYVDIKGAINNPGVYDIESDKRIIDVINKAGGLTENANTSFTNLAKKVEDSMVIIIYTNEEIESAKKDDNISYIVDNNCICPSIKNDACLDNNTKKNNTNTKSNNKENDSNQDNNIITDKININTASLLDLQTIPGIGESKAKAIIEYRDNEGIFNNIEDIKNVSGIGDSLYEKIKEYITV